MTESAPHKPWLTRRRVIAGAVVLVLVMAVVGFVFSVFDGRPRPAVKVTVDRFQSVGGAKEFIAVVTLSNSSPTSDQWVCFNAFRAGDEHLSSMYSGKPAYV